MKFDLHLHTARHSPDATSDPYELVQAAIQAGLDGIVITEHDYLWTESELDELRTIAPGLVILAGIEVTGKGGDILCYGVTNPLALPRGMEWGLLTREVHRQGGVCIAAHPHRWNQPFENILHEQAAELDGIEVMSKNMDDELRRQAQELLRKYPQFAQLGNSDSHEPETVGCCYTEFATAVRTMPDLVAAIRQRQCRASTNDTFASRRMLR
ncbi:MAG: PHP domain-containing protein [Gemmataceae bacterium]|nr:PHP domain-containing protein [Gemmata sp.]MDW8198960.1 PHP domain-containing protein [Gemmataceae bacterium]